MKPLIITIAALSLSACATQQEPLCDRDAVEWDKYGTAYLPLECMPKPLAPVLVDDPHDPMMPPTTPPTTEPPKHEPPVSEPPAKREKGNNGLGNGDQRAPGNSLDRNRAENERGNPGHKSGKAQSHD